MGEWKEDSKTHISTMNKGDFRNNEKSLTLNTEKQIYISHTNLEGKEEILKDDFQVQKGEVIDASVLNKEALVDFIQNEIIDAKNSGLLLSLHLKATMMKVSDPIIFGHVVRIFLKDVFKKFSKIFNELEVNPNDGVGTLLDKVSSLEPEMSEKIMEDIDIAIKKGPYLAMVNSDENISNLHVPSDIIIDASMPAMIKNSGKMWNRNNEMMDTKAIIPDSSYSLVYKATIDFCKKKWGI